MADVTIGGLTDAALPVLGTDKMIVSRNGTTLNDTAVSNLPVSTATQAALDAKVSTSVLTESVQDIIGTSIIAGTNVTVSYNDTTGNTTISATGGGSGVADGDKGDITVSGTGSVWTIDNDAVTYAKIQNVSATDKLLGRSTAGAGDIEEITCTSAGRAILDDADATAQRATLGLVIGTNVQAFDQQLADVAGLTPNDNGVIIGNGTNFVVESGATLKTSLGLTIGTDIQAYDVNTAKINVSNNWTKSQNGNIATATYGATIALNLDNSGHEITTAGNFQLIAPTNQPAAGYYKSGYFDVIQGATGGAMSIDTAYWDVVGGTVPTGSTGVGKRDTWGYIARNGRGTLTLSVKDGI